MNATSGTDLCRLFGVSTEIHHICHRQGSRRLTLRQLFEDLYKFIVAGGLY